MVLKFLFRSYNHEKMKWKIVLKLNPYLHKTVNVCSVDFRVLLGVFLAVQYTCFPLSDFSTFIDNDDTVLTKPMYVFLVNVEWSVTSDGEIYHLMSAAGLQYDDVQVKFICFPAVTMIDVGFKVTDVTGTEY